MPGRIVRGYLSPSGAFPTWCGGSLLPSLLELWVWIDLNIPCCWSRHVITCLAMLAEVQLVACAGLTAEGFRLRWWHCRGAG